MKPARVGEHRALPADELVQSAAGFDHFNAGPQPKMISVAKDYPGIEVGSLQFFEANSLHRAGSPDRHEDGRLDFAATRSENTRAGLTFSGLNLKGD